MENKDKLKWHQKPTTIILLLIFFFPLGLYFMWKNKLWTIRERSMVSFIFILIIIGVMTNEESVNACDCVELEGIKRIGASYDYDKYNECKSKYGTYRMMEVECINEMGGK